MKNYITPRFDRSEVYGRDDPIMFFLEEILGADVEYEIEMGGIIITSNDEEVEEIIEGGIYKHIQYKNKHIFYL